MALRPTETSRAAQIISLMRSDDSRAIKNGIQGAYELLRAHPNTGTAYVNRIRNELSRHLKSQDPLVAPWIYSLIAVLRDRQYEPYLRTQLAEREFDPVNRTWAVSSLASVTSDYTAVLNAIGEDLSLPFQLASGMFHGTGDGSRAVRRASDSDDRLAHLWIALLFGEQRADIPLAQITELTVHRDAEVAQYALYALHKNPSTDFAAVGFGPQHLEALQPRIRRWYYQLVIKDASNLDRFGFLVRQWIETETHTQAREGLAKAFMATKLERDWIHDMRAWAESEQDPFVLDALAQVSIVRDIVVTRRVAASLSVPSPLERTSRSYIGQTKGPVYFLNSRLTVSEVGSLTMVDNRNQSVTVGDGNTIASVQGAYSVASVRQEALAQPSVADYERLVAMLQRIGSLVREEAGNAQDAELVEMAASDVQEALITIKDTPETGLDRLRLRVKQASLAIGALIGLSAGMNELVTETQELIEHLS